MLGAAQIVFKREGVQREPGQVDARGGFDDVLNGFGALLVAEESLERALARPAAVAVHNDGDVLRKARGVEAVVDGALVGGELVGPVGALVKAGWSGFTHVWLVRLDDKAGNVIREQSTDLCLGAVFRHALYCKVNGWLCQTRLRRAARAKARLLTFLSFVA